MKPAPANRPVGYNGGNAWSIFNTPLMNAAPDKVKMPLIEMTQFPKRLGNPPEYAAMVCHMVENTFLNGETIRLDGGIRMQPR